MKPAIAPAKSAEEQAISPTVCYLAIERFRGIKSFTWHPAHGVNLVLGGGDVGKTTILEAIGLLLHPATSTTLSDADYHARDIDSEFSIEAILALPANSGISLQAKQSWPWEWNGKQAVVPNLEEGTTKGQPVYRLRVRGTAELELLHEIIQPDGTTTNFTAALRRSIGLVRLSGDDRNDRDLRLVQGSALDRLLSDRSLRSRMASELASTNIKDQLLPDAQNALDGLDKVFEAESLPRELGIAITGSQGLSVAALIGLTAKREGVSLPLASWGAGTRRLSALAIAAQKQGDAPITVVDEIERGLEPYRQRFLLEKLQAGKSQVFVTTHSPSVISAAADATLWYIDHQGQIGELDSAKTERHRKTDPETFLSRLTIVAEGLTEVGFVTSLLERALPSSLEQLGIHVTNGGGHESSLDLLEALAKGGLHFGGFADEEGKHPTRWKNLEEKLEKLLFRWAAGCTEQSVLNSLADDKIEAFVIDPADEKTGMRLRTLADHLGIDDKTFVAIKTAAGANIKSVVISAALGTVPENVTDKTEKKRYQGHAQVWFKSETGGRELAGKVFALGLWPAMRPQLLPFCNAVRKAVKLPEIMDITA